MDLAELTDAERIAALIGATWMVFGIAMLLLVVLG